MFDDEDYPDYFLDDEAEEAPRQPSTQPTQLPPQGRVIQFDTPAGQHREKNIGKPGCTIGATMTAILFIIIGVMVTIGYFRYMSPCVEGAQTTAIIKNIETRGTLFKTYEAEIAADRQLGAESQTTGIQQVSIATPELAERLKRYHDSGQVVTLVYKQYHATVPWRGESTTVITDIRE